MNSHGASPFDRVIPMALFQKKTNSGQSPEDIEVDNRYILLRLILVALLLLIGTAGIAYGVMNLVSPEKTWEEIEIDSAARANLSDEITVQYNLGEDGGVSAVRRKQLITLYSTVMVSAYRQFNVDAAFEDIVSLYQINHTPNEIFTVEDLLYSALETLQKAGDRTIYLGPAYAQYSNTFFCHDDSETVDFDPLQNEELATFFGEVAAFARDPASVDFELLGNNQVRLKVSDAYLQYARENGIETFVDFMWLRNAFIVDYLAQQMIDQGFTYGIITSCDGYERNLDNRAVEQYGFNLYTRVEDTVYTGAVMRYTGARALVNYREYSLGPADLNHFYTFRNGDSRGPYLSLENGMPITGKDQLVCYSAVDGVQCVDLILASSKLFLTDADDDLRMQLARDGVHTVTFRGTQLTYTEPELKLEDLYQTDALHLTAVLLK